MADVIDDDFGLVVLDGRWRQLEAAVGRINATRGAALDAFLDIVRRDVAPLISLRCSLPYKGRPCADRVGDVYRSAYGLLYVGACARRPEEVETGEWIESPLSLYSTAAEPDTERGPGSVIDPLADISLALLERESEFADSDPIVYCRCRRHRHVVEIPRSEVQRWAREALDGSGRSRMVPETGIPRR